jgi:MOSC domain-containing protein YiiM
MKIRHIYISSDHNFFGHYGQEAGDAPMTEVTEIECVAAKGLRGDRFFDYKEDYNGQVTFFSWEVYKLLCEKFDRHDAPPSVFRRNIIVEDTDLDKLIGKEFTIQGITFLGTQEAAPCFWMNQAFAEGAHDFMKGMGGLRAKILTTGTLRPDA